MMKSSNSQCKGSITLSPVFVVLVVVAFSIFGFAMINLTNLPTPEEKREESIRQMEELMIIEEAQTTGQTIDEVKLRQQESGEKEAALNKLVVAINQKDDATFENSLSDIKVSDVITRRPGVLYYAVVANNAHAFRKLLEAGIPCDSESGTGRQAFTAAISSASPEYLEMLLEQNCEYLPGTNRRNLEKQIIVSLHPEKIYQLSEKFFDGGYRDEAFLNAIRKRMSQQVQTMLDLGANPNVISKDRDMSALYMSLNNQMPQIAMRLIQMGADIKSKDSSGTHALTVAIRKGYLEIVEEMLRRDPEYIRRENLGSSSFAYAFKLKEEMIRREAITLLLQNGVAPQEFKDGGVRWLIKAVQLQDPVLVTQLLDAGIDPNIPSNMSLALGIAKSSKGTHKDEIISLLERHDASDDLLAVVKKEKGIKPDSDCSLGRLINVEYGSIAEKFLQRVQKASATSKPTSRRKQDDTRPCAVAILDCVNLGHGSDDCMRSVQICGTSKTDQDALCCTSDIQKLYFEARCSGLDVKESTRWVEMHEN